MKSVKKLRFPGQQESEEIQLLIRKHWIIDIKVFSIFLIIGLMPIVFGVLFGNILWESTHGDVFWTYVLVWLVYMLFIDLFVYLKWLNEELDIVIVTNERIVSHNQINLFKRQISEANIIQIQDVKGQETGLLGHLFHFGTLEITTASNEIFFIIQNISNPYENTRALLDVRKECALHYPNS